MKYKKRVLGNGLTILEVPGTDAESVVVDIFVKTGSRSETPKENGISHFLEHFLFKGTKKYPSALKISELVDAIGGEMNANTGKEHTQYFIKAASKHMPLIFDVLTDMVQNPLLDSEELEREKGVIAEEINMYRDLPPRYVESVLEEAMWPGQALGRDIAGQVPVVKKFNRKMFQDYLSRHYQTPNMILGISGKYNHKLLDKLIKKRWGNHPKHSFHRHSRVEDKQKNVRVKLAYKDTEQAHLIVAFKGFDYKDKRNMAALVLSAILGGGMSSRMFTQVRERRGLAYYVTASNQNYQDTGIFSVNSGVQVKKAEEATVVIIDELKKIKRYLVDDRELNKAKEYIKGKSTLALEDNQIRLDWFMEEVAFKGKIVEPKKFFEQVDKVTAKDVQAVAKDLFQNKKLTFALIGPYKSEKQFKKILKV